MISDTVRKFILPHEFFLPFAGNLNPENQWCRMAAMIPWWKYEDDYNQAFKNKVAGRKAKSVRMALGALIIQAKCGFTDEEVVQNVMENIYMQYFIGLEGFVTEPPFDSSLMVHFRKRLKPELINRILEDMTLELIQKLAEKSDDDDDDTNASPPDKEESPNQESETEQIELPMNHGHLILDATCVPADIRFPTDLGILNEAVENLWRMEKQLRAGKKVPKIAKKKQKTARNAYLSIVRQKRPRKKKIQNAIRTQLECLEYLNTRVLNYGSEKLERFLKPSQLKKLEVIQIVRDQQNQLYKSKQRSVPNRIVSLSQPHVRPMVRGKARANVEFGAKLSMSVVEGYCLLEQLSFDGFNEGITLIESAERYRQRFGYYPEAIMADKIYRNRANLAFCKMHQIRLSGPKLGRPPKDNTANKLQEYIDSGIRNAVEGKFGQAKRAFGLDLIKVRLEESSKSMILMNLLVINLKKGISSLFAFFQRLQLVHKYYLQMGLLVS